MSKEIEIWSVARYNNEVFEKYQVSSLGRVKSFYKKTPKILKTAVKKDGYYTVALTKNGKTRHVQLHRLVLCSFSEIPENWQEMFANHIDEDKSNNCLSNLNWLTRKENNNHGSRTERASKSNTNGKTSKTVYQYSLNGEFIREWSSLHEVNRQLGFSYQNISQCCLGNRRTAHGFVWSYEPHI